MEIERMCEYLAMVIQLPIREYDSNKKIKRVFGNFNIEDSFFLEDEIAISSSLLQNESIYLYIKNKTTLLTIKKKNELNWFVLGTLHHNVMFEDLNNHILDMDIFIESGLILNELINEEKTSKHNLLMGMHNEQEISDIHKKKIMDVRFQYHENSYLHNPYAQEYREQTSIKEGNLENLLKSFDEKYSGKLATLSRDKLRSVKNLGIVVLAISTRSAIQGGVHPEYAYLLSDSYILSVDESSKENEVYELVREAEINFTKLVASEKKYDRKSLITERAINFIFQNLHEKMTLEDISSAIETTPSYLAKIFKKEMGRTVHQFIINEKLNIAINLLIYSNYELEEISNYLAFSNQSHFGHHFKKKYGETPNQYRKKYRIEKG